ncbi:hypothetical protein BH10PSE16_BH10PSE16_39620 [soil metagenome]
MGRISASHVAGLDLIDKLFFNQILVLRLFTEELCWLKDLHADLDRELTHKGITGVQRQVVRHGVLCMMEVELSESLLLLSETMPGKFPALPENITKQQFEKVQKISLDFFQGTLLAMLSKSHQCDTLVVIEITNALLGKYDKAPATVRYRLVERMFAFEFMFAPIDCFTWLAKMGVLDSDKYPRDTLVARYSPEFLQRLALLCELDMQRDFTRRIQNPKDRVISRLEGSDTEKITDEIKEIILNHEDKERRVYLLKNLHFPVVNLVELESPARIEQFFRNQNTYSTRLRAFQGKPLSGWIGMLCGGYVEVLDGLQDQKKLIYGADLNEGSLTEKISNDMEWRGFEINPRTIYGRHRDFKETVLKFVTGYYKVMLIGNAAIPPNLKDLTYDGLAPHFAQLKPKPRRHLRSSSTGVKMPTIVSPDQHVWGVAGLFPMLKR